MLRHFFGAFRNKLFLLAKNCHSVILRCTHAKTDDLCTVFVREAPLLQALWAGRSARRIEFLL